MMDRRPQQLRNRDVNLLKKKSLTFRVSVANPQKLLYTLANPARGLLNMENKKIKEKSSRLWETFCPIA